MADDPYTPEPCPACMTMNDDDATVCATCGVTLEAPDGADAAPGAGSGSGTNAVRPPRDNLIRARVGEGIEVRASEDGGTPNELVGHFSKFNDWYEIESMWEGSFMERVLPGAFTDTIKNDRSSMRVLFDHGMDPSIGGKPLGPIRTLKEDDEGPYYEVDLLDTDYNRNFVIPALTGALLNGKTAGSQLGASFRFQVLEDQWSQKPKSSKHNPGALPERSIVRSKVFEFGPVTFPANAGASASARSLSDQWMARLAGDQRFFGDFSDRVGSKVAERVLASVPEDLRAAMVERIAPDATAMRQGVLRRRARALLVTGA